MDLVSCWWKFLDLSPLSWAATLRCDHILFRLAGWEALRYEAAAQRSQTLMMFDAATSEAFRRMELLCHRIGQKKSRLHRFLPRWDKRAAHRRKFKRKGVRFLLFCLFFKFFCFNAHVTVFLFISFYILFFVLWCTNFFLDFKSFFSFLFILFI